jgi:hypothetical protein
LKRSNIEFCNINGSLDFSLALISPLYSILTQYFGISPEDLENEISYFRYGESRGDVAPIHVDETGRPYIVFSTPNGPGRFYLEGKYQLRGELLTYTEEETLYWKKLLKNDE